MFQLAWPVFLGNFFLFLIATISLIFCGRLGKDELAAATLAISFSNVSGFAIGYGLSQAMDTLSTQAYGANNKMLVGTILQRSILIIGLFCLPVWGVWLNTKSLFIHIVKDEQVASNVEVFMDFYIPALPFMWLSVLLQKYLYTQGAGIAVVASYISMCLLMIWYIQATGIHEETWGGWSKESLMKWGEFIQLAVPSMLMTCIEWCGFEVATVLMSQLGTDVMGAQGILFQLDTLLFMPFLGIGVAAAIRVGMKLGEGKPDEAKKIAKLSMGVTLVVSLLVNGTLAALRDVIGRLFTSDLEVIHQVRTADPFLALFLFLDSMQACCAGSIRGCGFQKFGAIITIVCYNLLALPLSLSLTFYTDLRLPGFWIGISAGILPQIIAYVIVIWTLDWKIQSDLARARAGIEIVAETTNLIGKEESRPLLGNNTARSAQPYSSSQRLSLMSHYSQSFDVLSVLDMNRPTELSRGTKHNMSTSLTSSMPSFCRGRRMAGSHILVPEVFLSLSDMSYAIEEEQRIRRSSEVADDEQDSPNDNSFTQSDHEQDNEDKDKSFSSTVASNFDDGEPSLRKSYGMSEPSYQSLLGLHDFKPDLPVINEQSYKAAKVPREIIISRLIAVGITVGLFLTGLLARLIIPLDIPYLPTMPNTTHVN